MSHSTRNDIRSMCLLTVSSKVLPTLLLTLRFINFASQQRFFDRNTRKFRRKRNTDAQSDIKQLQLMQAMWLTLGYRSKMWPILRMCCRNALQKAKKAVLCSHFCINNTHWRATRSSWMCFEGCSLPIADFMKSYCLSSLLYACETTCLLKNGWRSFC